MEEMLREDQQWQKKYKADKFEIELEVDKKGEARQKIFEGYKAKKYLVKTIFTTTKYKFSLQEISAIK
jgi:hypothetical protein